MGTKTVTAIDPSGTASAVQMLSNSAEAPPTADLSMEDLMQRFEAMMERPRPPQQAGSEPGTLARLLEAGDSKVRESHDQVASLQRDAENLTPGEMLARSIEVSRAVSIGSFQLNVANSIVSGANKSLQSLLKNQ